MIEPVGPVERIAPLELLRNVTVNLAAPVVLTAHFLGFFSSWSCPRTILFVTSGAAQHPVEGWSGYCTSKAGLNMYAACIGLEQSMRPNPIRVAAISPGVVDTSMQEAVRKVSEDLFPERQYFVDLKERGALADPRKIAVQIAAILRNPEFENGSVVHL